MKKTMTNKEMVEAVNRIVAMQDRETENHEKLFGIKTNYAIRKNKAAMLAAMKPYDESLEALRDECRSGERAADGTIKISKDSLDKWESGVKELQSIEAEVDIHMVKFAEVEKAHLSLNDLEAIDFMLEEPEDFGE